MLRMFLPLIIMLLMMVHQLSLEISSFSSHDIFCITICCTKIVDLFETDHGQTKPKPKPRGTKKLQKLTAVEHEGESKCLFRATNGKKKLSTVVRGKIFD